MPGRQLKHWIAAALHSEREAANVPIEQLMSPMAMSLRTLKRLEDDDTEPQEPSYQSLEKAIPVYATALGIEDPRDIILTAMELWYREGSAPTVADVLPEEKASFVRPLVDRSRRRKQAPVAPEERLRAIRQRKGQRGAG